MQNTILLILAGVLGVVIISYTLATLVRLLRARKTELVLPNVDELEKPMLWNTVSHTESLTSSTKSDKTEIKINKEITNDEMIYMFDEILGDSRKKITVKRLSPDFITATSEYSEIGKEGKQVTKKTTTPAYNIKSKEGSNFDEMLSEVDKMMDDESYSINDVNERAKRVQKALDRAKELIEKGDSIDE